MDALFSIQETLFRERHAASFELDGDDLIFAA